jgi:hypothetical protein
MGLVGHHPEQARQTAGILFGHVEEDVSDGGNHLVGRQPPPGAPAHSVGQDRQETLRMPRAGEYGHPVLLLGTVADMLGRAGGYLETRHGAVAMAERGSLSCDAAGGRNAGRLLGLIRTEDRLPAMEMEQIKQRIIELQVEHRDLDEAIDRLAAQPGVDELKLRRLKKRKLQIKDSIAMLQMQLVPDVPA